MARPIGPPPRSLRDLGVPALRTQLSRSPPGERAGGGGRTHTPLARPGILSPVRLPVPPLRGSPGFAHPVVTGAGIP